MLQHVLSSHEVSKKLTVRPPDCSVSADPAAKLALCVKQIAIGKKAVVLSVPAKDWIHITIVPNRATLQTSSHSRSMIDRTKNSKQGEQTSASNPMILLSLYRRMLFIRELRLTRTNHKPSLPGLRAIPLLVDAYCKSEAHECRNRASGNRWKLRTLPKCLQGNFYAFLPSQAK